MTPTELGIEGLKLCISSSLLLIAYFVVHRKSCQIAYRQDLFVTRNKLWDYARSRNLLDHPAHRELRTLANGCIRLAPVTNLLVFTPILLRAVPLSDQDVSLQALIKDLPDEEA